MAQLWQHPYVNVFKHFNLQSWKKASKEGDVAPVMDKTTKGTVYKIMGSIPASNYIQLPSTGSQSLGLTGRFLYLLFKPVPGKYFVVHIDVATVDGLVVRISFSNLFKEFKSTSTWLQFPFICPSLKSSVAGRTILTSRGDSGPAPSSTQWTVLCLDFHQVLSLYLTRSYSYVKNIKLCANMHVKNVFTSDTEYQPGTSVDEVKKLRLEGIAPMPRDMAFPLGKTQNWNDHYQFIKFPANGTKLPFDSIQSGLQSQKQQAGESLSSSQVKESTSVRVKPLRHTRHKYSAIDETSKPKRKLGSSVTSERPFIEKTRVDDVSIERTLDGDVHVFAHRDDPVVVHQKNPRSGKVTSKKVHAPASVLPARKTQSLSPDPIMQLRRIIGFGGATNKNVLWTSNGTTVVYPCHAVVVAMQANNGRQRFFIGHTDKVSCISLNGSSSILASGQTGAQSVVRIWKFQTEECLAMFKTHAHSLHTLSFSQNGMSLCGVGRDRHGKNMVVVWNTRFVASRNGEVSIVAKAHTDVDICAMKIAEFDETRLVSCGRDNIRLWRVKDGSLRSAPVNLAEYHNMEFTDCCFEAGLHPTRDPLERLVYACSKTGHIFEVDLKKVSVLHVRRLLPLTKAENRSKHRVSDPEAGSGISINSMCVNEAFCVTGSDDGYLRLWPLDFKNVYLEAEHEGPVTAVNISADGVKILAATATGNLGVMDVSTRNYTTIMRSHTGTVNCMALDSMRRHLATVSEDNSIRVWDCDTMQQMYDFGAPSECPCCISYHPTQQVFAVGFESGTVRVFSIPTISMIAEHKQHRGRIIGVAYSTTGDYLYSADSNGALALYEAIDNRYQVLRVLPNTVARGDHRAPTALAVSADGHVAFVGPAEFTVTVVNGASLDEVLRIDISVMGSDAIDSALRIHYPPASTKQLLVTTSNNRLLKFDARSGKLQAEIANIHRSGCTTLDTTVDTRHLATCGDHVIKIWDYHMRLDLNFQVFIGHAENITGVTFTPDLLSVISCGEAIFMWDFLAHNIPKHTEMNGRELVKNYYSGTLELPDAYRGISQSAETSALDHPRERAPTPTEFHPFQSFSDLSAIDKPSDSEGAEEIIDVYPTTETVRDARLTEPAPDITQLAKHAHHSSAHDKGHQKAHKMEHAPHNAHHKAHSTAHHKVRSRAQGEELEEVGGGVENISLREELERSINEGHSDRTLPDHGDSHTLNGSHTLNASLNGSHTVTEHVQPAVFKHFSSREKSSALDQRRYTAPPNLAGIELKSVIGYNGNGRGNMVWHPDTGVFAYTSGCLVVVEDLNVGTQRHLTGHLEEVSTLALQHDCQVLASVSGPCGTNPAQICIWDLQQMTCRHVLQHHKNDVVRLTFSRDDRFLISMGDYRDCQLVIWSTEDYTVLTTTTAPAPIHDVAWDPSTVNEFVSVGAQGTVMFWLLDETGDSVSLNVHEAQVPNDLLHSGISGGANKAIDLTCAVYGSDSTVFIGTSSGKMSAWDSRSNTCYMHWEADTAEISGAVYKSGRLLTGGASCGIKLWSVAGIVDLQVPVAQGGFPKQRGFPAGGLTMDDEMSLDGILSCASFDDTLDMGVVGTTSGTLWYINWVERTSIRLVPGHKAKITDIAVLDSQFIATSCEDGIARVWCVEDREPTLQFQVMNQSCNCVAFSPEKRRSAPQSDEKNGTGVWMPSLVAGYSDGTVRMFDLNKMEMVLKMHPHACAVTAVLFSSDGCMILSGASDGLVALSSPTTGMTVRVISDHKGAPITSINCAPHQEQDSGVRTPSMWMVSSADMRISVWSSDWTSDVCELVDWLTFPTPTFTPEGDKIKQNSQRYYGKLPPTIAQFSPHEEGVIVYTGYGMNKLLQFYSLAQKKVFRTTGLTHWPQALHINPTSPLVAIATKERLVKLYDYYEGTFQDFLGHDDSVRIVRFSSDGRHLYSSANTELLTWTVNM